MKKLSQQEASDFIKSKGGELLSEYKNSRSVVEVKCLKHNFTWTVRYISIKNGCWCKKCAKNYHSSTEEVINFIEKERKWTVVDISGYKTAKSVIKVQCPIDNHIWPTNWDRIQKPIGCPKCSERVPLTEQELIDLVKDKKCSIIEMPERINNNSKVKVKCDENGHIWTPYISALVHRDPRCPKCDSSAYQQRFFEILNSILKEDEFIIDCHPFKWLRNHKTNRPLEIDIWFPKLKLAIEYDGEQHFRPVKFGGVNQKDAEKQFEDMKFRDALKNKLISEHPDEVKYFIRIPYTEKLTEENIKNILKKHKVPIPK